MSTEYRINDICFSQFFQAAENFDYSKKLEEKRISDLKEKENHISGSNEKFKTFFKGISTMLGIKLADVIEKDKQIFVDIEVNDFKAQIILNEECKLLDAKVYNCENLNNIDLSELLSQSKELPPPNDIRNIIFCLSNLKNV